MTVRGHVVAKLTAGCQGTQLGCWCRCCFGVGGLVTSAGSCLRAGVSGGTQFGVLAQSVTGAW